MYLPKVRDKVVLEGSIRDAAAKLDPKFAYADSFDEATGKYHKLTWAKTPPDFPMPTAMIVREAEAKRQLQEDALPVPRLEQSSSSDVMPEPREPGSEPPGSTARSKPHRFYGSVELDMVRPVKSFDTILNAVVMELQRTHGAKVKLTLEIEAEASDGFADSEVGVVRDNARQLKFKPESTGFED
ncbi:hypothetical protein [Ancylobacter sp.]|uniref:hypothetical protein n=1 Tax=Ancylobacter sp. TaxID=1872567 RepID=UPI003D121E11